MNQMSNKRDLARVEKILRTYIEAGLESGEVVLDDMMYGFEPTAAPEAGMVMPDVRNTCQVCILGCAVRAALAEGFPVRTEASSFNASAHRLLGAAALEIAFEKANALESGFMASPRIFGVNHPDWYGLGARLRADYYS